MKKSRLTPRLSLRSSERRAFQAAFALLIAIGTIAIASGAAAAAPPPPLDLPAGLACGFALRIQQAEPFQAPKEFFDKNGNLVRTMTTGKGVALTFTNLSNGNTYSVKANGSNLKTTIDPVTGIATVSGTGHNVIIFFPTDVPAGPSTTLFTGQVQYMVTPDGVFTLTKTAGKTLDICAQLA